MNLLSYDKRMSMKAASILFRSAKLFSLAGWLGRTSLKVLPHWATHHRFNTWTIARELPQPPKESFRSWYAKNRKSENSKGKTS